MKTGDRTRLVHVGEFIAEVEVELIEGDEGWAPYLSVEDAQKMDSVKQALESGDLRKASALARVFRMTPLNV